MKILERFLKYISIPTNSSSKYETVPSTEDQFILAKLLVDELKELNMDEVYFDEEHCYVYAVLKGNENSPKVGFITHLDTSEEVTDKNITPQIIKNYDGNTVRLNEKEVLDVNIYPELKKHKGKTLITTDGTTLLGADDKAGIAEVMTMLEYIINNNIEHGDIYIAFTPDEEVGKSIKYLDFSKFKVDFAYTIDGYDLGEISYENFNASTIIINIEGVTAHLGKAKNILVNSQLIANEILNLIPKEFPQTTEGYEGYYHLQFIEGNVANTKMTFCIRDFEKDNFEKRKQVIIKIVEDLNKKYSNCITVDVSDRYYNMKDVISKKMHIVDNAILAMKNVNVEPMIHEIRGGTDGAKLAEKGIACPNLGTGGNNFHGIHEYICVEDMEKVVEVLVEIVRIYSKVNND